MQARHLPFAAKLRRYRHLARQVNRMLKDGTFRLLPATDQKNLLQKLRQRLKAIGQLLPQHRLREALAGIALLFGTALANPLDAQTFAPAVPSPFGLAPGSTGGYPAFADIDGDGDLDMFRVGVDVNTYLPAFIFYENTGSPESPVFVADAFELNPFGLLLNGGSTMPVFADFDNDGDLDLLATNQYYGNFLFFENTGTATNPVFAAPLTDPFGLAPVYVNFPTAADIDNDGDLDLFAGSLYSSVLFFENTGTPQAPAFANPVTNPYGMNPAGLVIVPNMADLDSDGDFDLLYMAFNVSGSQIFYAQNTGTPESPVFSTPVLNPFGIGNNGLYVAIPLSADIDNDGDSDVFINDYYGSAIYFYQNTTISIQLPPTAADNTVTTPEDVPYSFKAADFKFMDANFGDQLSAVRIVSLPVIGELKLNGVPVVALQEINAMDLTSLVFHAVPDDNGSPYSSFDFQVSDGTDWSLSEYVMTINVSPVNDAPFSANAEIDVAKNGTHTFSTTDFPFNDVDGDALQAIQIISTVDRGVLQLNGTAVTVNQIIPVASLDQLTYIPVANEKGTPYTSFTFKVSDGTVLSANSFIMTINVTDPNASQEAELDAEVQLSPNPARGLLLLKIQAAQPFNELRIKLFDETGRAVSTLGFAEQGNTFERMLDVRDFTPGVYWVKIEASGKVKTLKFVKS